jgi:hypothetical protein
MSWQHDTDRASCSYYISTYMHATACTTASTEPDATLSNRCTLGTLSEEHEGNKCMAPILYKIGTYAKASTSLVGSTLAGSCSKRAKQQPRNRTSQVSHNSADMQQLKGLLYLPSQLPLRRKAVSGIAPVTHRLQGTAVCACR